MKIIKGISHLDHGLSVEAVKFIEEKLEKREGFFIETFELPREFGQLKSALYGPLCGDPPISEEEVSYVRRGDRNWDSRMVDRPERDTSIVTVVAGPIDEDGVKEDCVLYTVYGGPCAPQEPVDPNCRDLEESDKFWDEHALAR